MSKPDPRATEAAKALIERSGSIAVVMHVNPDGDAIGGAIALTLALRGMGKSASIVCPQRTPEIYDFLEPQEYTADADAFQSSYLAALVDCGDAARTGDLESFVNQADSKLVIDHHPTTSDFGDVRLVDEGSSSACEVIYHLLRSAGAEIQTETACALMTGIITDTGCFRFRNTSPDTLEAAAELARRGASTADISQKVYDTRSFAGLKLLGRALSSMRISPSGNAVWAKLTLADYADTGALPEDTEGFVNIVHALKGADVAAILREEAPGKVRVSFRSRGGAPVNKAAEALGGGGHEMAAACVIEGSLDQAEQLVLEELRRWISL